MVCLENIPGVVVISTIRISVGVVLDWKRQWTKRQTKNHPCEPLSIFLPTRQTVSKETHVISVGGGRRGRSTFSSPSLAASAVDWEHHCKQCKTNRLKHINKSCHYTVSSTASPPPPLFSTEIEKCQGDNQSCPFTKSYIFLREPLGGSLAFFFHVCTEQGTAS